MQIPIPMPPEPIEPWQNPWRNQPPSKPTKAEQLLKDALRESAKTHIARMFGAKR